MDRRMMRDGRNPYGSRGGYVDTTRGGRRMDYGYDRRSGRADYTRHHSMVDSNRMMDRGARYSNMKYAVPIENPDYERYDRNRRDYGYDRGEYRPIEIMGRFGGYYSMDDSDYYGNDYTHYDYYGDYRMDYGEDLKYYEKRLMEQIEPNVKNMLDKQQVLSKARNMGIRFDKYNEDEFFIVVLMMATDFGKTIGTSNIDVFIRMARDWLEDKDSNLKYADKLYEYLDRIVDGE